MNDIIVFGKTSMFPHGNGFQQSIELFEDELYVSENHIFLLRTIYNSRGVWHTLYVMLLSNFEMTP